MKQFPRGSLPPSAYVEVAKDVAPPEVERPQSTVACDGDTAQAPRGTSDLASTCPNCRTLMQPEHAHYRCLTCGYRDACCS